MMNVLEDQADAAKAAPSLLPKPAVRARTGLGNTTIYELCKLGKFPLPIKATKRKSLWISTEVDAWVSSQIQAAKAARGAKK